MLPIISFVGRHNSGKTTILNRVIDRLSVAGYKIALIKHAHHDLKIAGEEDSEILLRAGAQVVTVSSPQLSIQYRRHNQEPAFMDLLQALPPSMDMLIVEGFKQEPLPKIEVLRQEISAEPMLLPRTMALITDFPLKSEVPVIDHQDTEGIIRFMLKELPIRKDK